MTHLSKKQMEFERLMKHRPHVVILGSGATVAAIPNGDKNGNCCSCMDCFIEKAGLYKLIDSLPLHTASKNLEDVYSEIFERSINEDLFAKAKDDIEEKIFDYLCCLELPSSPTIYDYLLLSLREKDVVATFNWDPLIIQAGFRILQKISAIKLPKILCLHGNVALYFEKSTNKIRFSPYGKNIDANLKKTKLLFPIKNKNYESDNIISDSWKMLKAYLRRAYMVTIFGYSAPKTDTAAISMLKEAWGDVSKRNLEEIEVVDIKDKHTCYSSWKDFIFTHHFTYANDFFKSTLGCFPRRTIEQLFDSTMNCLWVNRNRGFKEGMTLDEALLKIKPLLYDEALKNDGLDKMLVNPYNECFKGWTTK